MTPQALVGRRVYVGLTRWTSGRIVDTMTDTSGVTTLYLDWGALGTSRVRMNDRGKIWWFVDDLS